MELNKAKVAGKDMISIKEFCEKYADNVKPQSITYAIKNNKVDYTWLGEQRMIVLTEKTLSYKPNNSKNRGVLGADTKRG